MRPIKFRGLDEKGVFHYGNLLQSKEYKDGRVDCYIQPKSILCLGAISTPTTSFVKVKESSVGEFTGLTDKNGVDIYEGDVLSQHKNCMYDAGQVTREVRFDQDQFLSGDCSLHSAIFSFGAEVIGNIHQSPELMESK